MTTTSTLQALLSINFPQAPICALHREPQRAGYTDHGFGDCAVVDFLVGRFIMFALRYDRRQMRRIRRRENVLVHDEVTSPRAVRADEQSRQVPAPVRCQDASRREISASCVSCLLLFFFFFSICACTSTNLFSSIVLTNLIYPTHSFSSRLFFRGSSFSGIVPVTPLQIIHHQESKVHFDTFNSVFDSLPSQFVAVCNHSLDDRSADTLSLNCIPFWNRSTASFKSTTISTCAIVSIQTIQQRIFLTCVFLSTTA